MMSVQSPLLLWPVSLTNDLLQTVDRGATTGLERCGETRHSRGGFLYALIDELNSASFVWGLMRVA